MHRTALITGASRGLGAELAAFLAAQDYDLVLTARGADELAVTARALSTPGCRVIAIAGDVADAEHRRQLIAAAEVLGGLDLLVNNASDLGPSPLPCWSISHWKRLCEFSRSTSWRLSAWSRRRCRSLRRGAACRQHLQRRGHRRLSGLGRLRRKQGGARPCVADARQRTQEP